MHLIINITSLPSVSKLKPTLLCYLPYLNTFFGIILPAKQALKSTLVILTPPAAPLASNTHLIDSTHTHLYTASIAFKASAANKYKKLSAPPPLKPPKSG